jgi:DNA processing protein
MMTTRLEPDAPAYPALLAAIPSPPSLDVRGVLEPADALAIAIVGSRRATPYGLQVAERLAAELGARGVTIVSGLARGIDAAAHRGALEAGARTLAVLGCGIDIVYPPEHRELTRRIEDQGAVVSQFPAGTPPLARYFPARNRTLAGLALGVVVVEAAERSGALITAGFAGELGREVYAIPGPVTSGVSRGSHRLLQDGAKLVQHWTDVVQELPEHWRRTVLGAAVDTTVSGSPSPGTDEERVLELLSPETPQHIEQVITRSPLEPSRVTATLTALELGGWARQLAGQRWMAATPRVRRS